MKKQLLNNMDSILYHFSFRSVRLLLLALTGGLLLSGALVTCYATDMESQLVLMKWDNLLFSLPGSGIALLLLSALAARLSHRAGLQSRRLLRFFVFSWCLAAGSVLIVFGRSVPAGDGYSVYSIAERLATGDTSVIHPTDSYLSYYPQQIGLAAFWELLIRIWNLVPVSLHAYHFIKIIYVLLGCAILFFQEKTVRLLWQDEKAQHLYLLLAGTCCPLLMYTSFVYGEIPSFAALSAGLYLLLRLLSDDGPRLLLALGSAAALAASVLMRKNSLIFVIAAVIVLALWGIRQKRPMLFLLAALCAAGSFLVLPCAQRYYERRSNSTLRTGVPAISYVAMGMQESSRANGWYNGFNFYTYQDTGMDTEATAALSLEAIRERLAYFRENPDYTVRFYLGKFLSQWADGTYACRQATLATFGGRSPLFQSLYEGALSRYLIACCNIYQNLLYLGAFWFCLLSLRRTPSARATAIGSQLPAFVGLIGVLGGFLFHMAWEGNARYILPYGLALLPYAAIGLSRLGDTLAGHLRR